MTALSRRLIPPLGALRALEALDRLGSATAVAQELDLSQSAVSRQIRTLEDSLGVPLVVREKRSLRLTPEARDYAQVVRAALDRIAGASMALRLPDRAGTLDLAMLPSFGMRWLVPRLPDFTRRHPEVTVNLATRIRPCDFASEAFDAAIEFGGPARPGTERLRLKPESVLPVCAPPLLPGGPRRPEDLSAMPLLHIETRPHAWRDWFAAQGHRVATPPGTTFDQFTAIREGAKAGLGVALLPDYLIETELATGALVPATEVAPVTLGAYHLVWPVDRPRRPALERFRDWLATMAEAEDDPLPR
ncbi:LysR family transcriptional regulator [Roseivivax isoporae LMG 25204]|uniref:LysR family transcriptional regulator n=1 Tax=Roseivivax isoporae LMG 25204 TaxID=1449351 RepID=X7F9K7_9RHOB|nr:LysR family transcriptional regulator [Roseivivax isoporae LMG 25204]